MSLKGNLSSVNLTEIFQMLSLSGREGTLFIYEGARKRSICFTKDGVSIRSRERNESNLIGKILVRLAKIDEHSLQQAIEERRAADKLLGDVLIEMAACTREDVELAFRIQSEEDIQELFLSRSDAQFEYVDGYFPETETPFVNLNVNSLLIEIARRTDEWEYIRRRIRGPREIYRFTGVEGSVEADVLAECYAHRVDPLVDGTRSVGDVIEASYVSKFEICKLLAAYLDAGVVELVPPDAIRQNARLALRMGDTSSAIRHYEYLMSTGDFPLDVMGEAAEAHEANRDFAEAAALLRRLAEELVRGGDYRGAIDALRRVANFPRPEPDALRYLLELVFDNPRAAQEFTAHIVEAGKTLVAYQVKHEQRDEALELLERLVKAFPDEVAFAVSLVNIHYEDGDAERAAEECERLAANFLKRRTPSPAVSLYKKLLIIDPDRQDIRDKIRKIVSGKRRRAGAGALPRVAVAVAVTLLLSGVALVLLRSEPSDGGSGGIDDDTLAELIGRAKNEQGVAEEHGDRAIDEYQRLLEELGDDPLTSRESLLSRLRVAEKRFQLFEERAEKAMSIAETIRRQTADEEVAARARAMLATLKTRETDVHTAKGKWSRAAQRAAEKLRGEASRSYQEARLGDALERFVLAKKLATRREWVREVDLDRPIQNLRGDVDRVQRKLKMARQRESDEDWTNARRIYLELLREFRDADLVQDLRLPVEILTVPQGASIYLDRVELPEKTNAIVRLSPFRETTVVLKKKNFRSESFLLGPFREGTSAAKYAYTRFLLKTATWSRNLRDHIESAPVAWGGRVAVVTRNGNWFVLNAESGKRIYSSKLKTADGVVASVSAGLASDGKSVFIPALEGELFAFNGLTCKKRYSVTGIKAGLYATPVVADGVIYVVDHAGNVSARDPKTLKRIWRVRTSHGVRAAPVIQGEDIVVVSLTGNVHVIRRSTGDKVISYRLPGSFACGPATAGTGDLVFGSEAGMLYGVNRVTGDIQWRRKLGSPITTAPQVRGRYVFVAPKPGKLVAFDRNTGDEIYRYSRAGVSSRAPVAKTGRIFFANGRTLSAFAPRSDGYGLAWTFQAEGRILAGPVVAGNAVYVGDEKGHIYRLEANG